MNLPPEIEKIRDELANSLWNKIFLTLRNNEEEVIKKMVKIGFNTCAEIFFKYEAEGLACPACGEEFDLETFASYGHEKNRKFQAQLSVAIEALEALAIKIPDTINTTEVERNMTWLAQETLAKIRETK